MGRASKWIVGQWCCISSRLFLFMDHHDPKKESALFDTRNQTQKKHQTSSSLINDISSAVIVETRYIEIQEISARKRAENYRKSRERQNSFGFPE